MDFWDWALCMECLVLRGAVDVFDFSHTQTVGTRCNLQNERAGQSDWNGLSRRAKTAKLIIMFTFLGRRTVEVSGYKEAHMEVTGIKLP